MVISGRHSTGRAGLRRRIPATRSYASSVSAAGEAYKLCSPRHRAVKSPRIAATTVDARKLSASALTLSKSTRARPMEAVSASTFATIRRCSANGGTGTTIFAASAGRARINEPPKPETVSMNWAWNTSDRTKRRRNSGSSAESLKTIHSPEAICGRSPHFDGTTQPRRICGTILQSKTSFGSTFCLVLPISAPFACSG